MPSEPSAKPTTTPVLELIAPHSTEYQQGREAYAAGVSYDLCPYPAMLCNRNVCPRRLNWFSGYWMQRARDLQPERFR